MSDYIKGIGEFLLAIEGISIAADKAAERTVRQGAFLEKKAIRANISGPPRWGMDNHTPQPRGGGPGIKTGRLLRSTRYKKVEKIGPWTYSTTIRSGRIYAAKVDSKYPFFERGVKSSEPLIAVIFERNMRAAFSL